jgi:hypothetical protein
MISGIFLSFAQGTRTEDRLARTWGEGKYELCTEMKFTAQFISQQTVNLTVRSKLGRLFRFVGEQIVKGYHPLLCVLCTMFMK